MHHEDGQSQSVLTIPLPNPYQGSHSRGRNQIRKRHKNAAATTKNALFHRQEKYQHMNNSELGESSRASSSAASSHDGVRVHTGRKGCMSNLASRADESINVIEPSTFRSRAPYATSHRYLRTRKKRLNLPAPLRGQKQRRLEDLSILPGKVVLKKSKDLCIDLCSLNTGNKKLGEHVHQGKVIRSEFETPILDDCQAKVSMGGALKIPKLNSNLF